MITLGIETSCDETAAGVVENGRVLSNEVSSSVHLHAPYGGVIPEIASRYHVEYIYSVYKKALIDAGMRIEDIGLIAVTTHPGLPGSLLTGRAFAEAVGFAAGKPVKSVNHVHAHITSCFIDRKKEIDLHSKFPFIGMVLSGGHSSIYVVKGIGNMELVGRTLDDAVGEAFDKAAKVMGLEYPGGPVIEARAKKCAGKDDIGFTRSFLGGSRSLDFSFSGIKTAILYYWQGSKKTESDINQICFSFQEAVFDVIINRVKKSVKHTGIKKIAIGGGVINNLRLRERVMELAEKEGIEFFLPHREFCADNAAMVAAEGEISCLI